MGLLHHPPSLFNATAAIEAATDGAEYDAPFSAETSSPAGIRQALLDFSIMSLQAVPSLPLDESRKSHKSGKIGRNPFYFKRSDITQLVSAYLSAQ